jgi:hypothetical protein
MRTALTRRDALAAAVIQQHAGTLLMSPGEGDSLFSVFPRATAAVAAACAHQQALIAEPWPTPSPLRERIALHTGEADLRDSDYYGAAVNPCARLRSIAHGGQGDLVCVCREAPCGLPVQVRSRSGPRRRGAARRRMERRAPSRRRSPRPHAALRRASPPAGRRRPRRRPRRAASGGTPGAAGAAPRHGGGRAGPRGSPGPGRRPAPAGGRDGEGRERRPGHGSAPPRSGGPPAAREAAPGRGP